MRGHLYGGGAWIQDGATKHVLADIALDAGTKRLIPLGFLAHAVAFHPKEPDRVAVFEKHGPGAAEVDLATGAVIRAIPTSTNRRFYGHGAYAGDGGVLWATESVLDDGLRGVLVIRDAATLAELGELPTHGKAPHDCVLLADQKTLVVTNGGGREGSRDRPSVVWIDVGSGRALETMGLESSRFNAGHVAIDEATGDVALVSAPRDGLPNPSAQLGAVSLGRRGGAFDTVRQPRAITRRMLGETLSVAVHGGRAIATHPLGNLVTCWDIATGTLIASWDLPEPRGVALDPDNTWFLVSHKHLGSVVLSRISIASGELDPSWTLDPSYTTGSHLFVRA